MMVELLRTKSTFADYVSRPETNLLVELIDGAIIVNPPLDQYQAILGAVYLYLGYLLRGNGTLRIAPIGLYVDEYNSYEPDLFWVAVANTTCALRPDGRYWQGAPDLIVEVLSPSTAYRDRGIKFQSYERLGVREYWMVETAPAFVEIHSLGGQGWYRQVGAFQAGETFHSPVLQQPIVVSEFLPAQES
jgi:Uma2 family endonuclease